MPVPKRKKSKSRTRQGRAHHAISAPNISACPKCGEGVMSHVACGNCGHYDNKKVIDVETKLDKKLKKKENKDTENE